jgi:hypothetical protein
MQTFGQKNQIVYKFNNTIFQLSSKQSDFLIEAQLKANSWVLPATIDYEIFALPQIDSINKNKRIHFVNHKYKKSFFLEWQNEPNENIVGSSLVTFMNNGDFYILSGGECSGENGYLYLWKGSYNTQTVTKVFKASVSNCNFGQFNENWNLETYD